MMNVLGGILLLIMSVPFIVVSIIDTINMKKKNVCGDMKVTIGSILILSVLAASAIVVILQGLGIIQ